MGYVDAETMIEFKDKMIDYIDSKIPEDMPTIRVISLTPADPDEPYFEGSHYAYLNVLVTGNIQPGDEITICSIKKSKKIDRGSDVVKRVRRRFRVLLSTQITEEGVYSLTIETTDKYLYSHNDSTNTDAPVWRFVRIRRQLENDSLFSNIVRIQFIYGKVSVNGSIRRTLTLH